MYEVTVSVPNEHKYFVQFVNGKMQNYMQKIGGTCANLQQKYRSYYCLACNDTFSSQTCRLLRECLSQVVAVGYKDIFIRNLLGIEQCNFYQNVLVDTMCVFDHQFDARMIASTLDVAKDVYLDGYYLFRMQEVKRKWKNIADMILENDYVLSDDKLVLEFLQYLLQSADSQVKQLSICFDDVDCTLYDSYGRVMPNCNQLLPNCTYEEKAMVNAINLNPKSIKVYHKYPLSQQFCNVANALFDTKFVQVQ